MLIKHMFLTAAAIVAIGAPAAAMAQDYGYGQPHFAGYEAPRRFAVQGDRGYQGPGFWHARFAPRPGFWGYHPYHGYGPYRPFAWGGGYHRPFLRY